MSDIKRLGKVEHEITEMRFSGDAMNVSYVQVTVTSNAYMCLGCGLAWAIKWHSKSCEDRNHVPVWEQRYGGYSENGIHKGYTAYERRALKRFPIPAVP